MRTLTYYIQEKLFIKKKIYNYFPETKEELKEIILQRIKVEGNEVNLNDIDTSEITDMSELFDNMNEFNGDISEWDVSNVTDMFFMFYGCKNFNQDISKWDVSNVTNNYKIFDNCNIEEKYKPKFK